VEQAILANAAFGLLGSGHAALQGNFCGI